MSDKNMPTAEKKHHQKTSRRKYLASVGGTGLALIAGCSGTGGGNGNGENDGSGSEGTTTTSGTSDGNNGSNSITITTPAQGTLAATMGTGMATTMVQNSDYQASSQPSTGGSQAMTVMLNGEAELSQAPPYTILDIMNSRNQFEGVDLKYKPLQVMSLYWARFMMLARTTLDYQMLSDLDGKKLAFGETSTSFIPGMEKIFGELYENPNFAYMGVNQLSSALSSGNIQMTGQVSVNGLSPSYSQQIVTENSTRALGWSDKAIQTVKDDPNITLVMGENSAEPWNKIDEFVMDGKTPVMSHDFVTVSSDNVSPQVVNDFLTTIWEQKDSLPDIHPAFNEYTNGEYWADLLHPDIPIHPGAATFLKDHDLWKDEFTEGSI
ncbi:TAXI family TRAP transporter solute-binding subunit [Halobellus sp. GM3]|uniref:TAXI family TRAP transporter solute-binding subunit n=1 Tax=Halobellus sp. GM3 TaxID=3458410 RepID=UPI00403DB965